MLTKKRTVANLIKFGKDNGKFTFDGVNYQYNPSPEQTLKEFNSANLNLSFFPTYAWPNPNFYGVFDQEFSSTTFRRPDFNACLNMKRGDLVVLPYAYRVWYRNRATGPIHRYDPIADTRLRDEIVAGLLNFTPADISDAVKRRAWAYMQPRFEGDFSILNFIAELKDFKDLVKLMGRNPFVKMPRLRSNRDIREVKRRPLSQSTGKSASGTVASAWLAWALMYAPLLRDFTAIMANLACSVEAAQQKYYEGGQELNRRHYTEVVAADDRLLWKGSYSTGYPEYRKTAKTVYTATMHYHYDYELRSSRDALVHYWGLQGNAEQLWNILPWTFVVDYFVKIGEVLHVMMEDPNTDLRLVRYCESVLQKTSVSKGFSPTSYTSLAHSHIVDGALIDRYTPFTEYSNSTFQRDLTAPRKIGLLVPKLKLPSKTQSITLAALLKVIF